MNVSSWSIRNPTPSILLFLLLSLIGIVAFKAMKIQNFPDIDLPTVTVVASLPGAAPSQMETEVARKIENSVATLQGVKNIYTKVQDGTASVTTSSSGWRSQPRKRSTICATRLRASARTCLETCATRPSPRSICPARPSSPSPWRRAAWTTRHCPGSSTTRLPSACCRCGASGAVARVGGVDREVRVELDPSRLLALNASAADISRQLRQIQQEASGGRADIGGAEQSVRTIATVQSADELSRLDIVLSDGRTRTPRSGRDRHGHLCRTALGRLAQWQTGGRLRNHAHAWRRRSRCRDGRAGRAGEAQGRTPGHRRSPRPSTLSTQCRRTSKARCGC